MLELNPFRKNKVNLQDYDYQKDIQNRLLMATLNDEDLSVLEEILYGHPKLTVSQLAQDLLIEETSLLATLKKLSSFDLFLIKDHTIVLNKEMRKYFESQLQKFEEDFIPGMEYLQSLLRKVPFHILLTWYPIPRTSDNIFDSLVEKYLLTPQIFQRYLMELHFPHPKTSLIVEEVYSSPDFSVSGKDLKKKHELTDEEFEEIMLHLEFNFVCCLVYKKQESEWTQLVQPFNEWKEYLTFIKKSKPRPIDDESLIVNTRESDFAFIEDMTTLYQMSKKSPLPLKLSEKEEWILDKTAQKSFESLIPSFSKDLKEKEIHTYCSKLIKKLLFLNLCKIEESYLKAANGSEDWISLSIENRALGIYKHTLSKLDALNLSSEIATERTVKEIEKTLNSIVHHGWVEFEDFFKSLTATVSKESRVILKKAGKSWKYALPNYTHDEVVLIKKTLLEWLFEAGLVSIGYFQDKQYFRVTSFGQTIFS